MNKPAAKEPSMDEILSSIRQIIADEDEPGNPGQSAPPAPPASENAADAAMLAAVPPTEPEPLALSPEQLIAEPESPEPESPEDDLGGISFNPEVQQKPIPAPVAKKAPPAPPKTAPKSDPQELPDASVKSVKIKEPALAPAVKERPALMEQMEPEEEIALVVADDVAFDEAEAAGTERPASLVSPSAPMPDAALSAEMAENLLAPATDAATRHAFSRLNALSIGGADLTLEAIVRDMLRPMLKEWLDENLPATVERMVEKEIERVSRGG